MRASEFQNAMRPIPLVLMIVLAVSLPRLAQAQSKPMIPAPPEGEMRTQPDRAVVLSAVRKGRADALVAMKKKIRDVQWRLGTLAANRKTAPLGRTRQRTLAVIATEERWKQEELSSLEERCRSVEAGEIDCGLPSLDFGALDIGHVGRLNASVWMVDEVHPNQFKGRPVISYYGPGDRSVSRYERLGKFPFVIRGIATENFREGTRAVVTGDFWASARSQGPEGGSGFVLDRFSRADVLDPEEQTQGQFPAVP